LMAVQTVMVLLVVSATFLRGVVLIHMLTV